MSCSPTERPLRLSDGPSSLQASSYDVRSDVFVSSSQQNVLLLSGCAEHMGALKVGQ